MVVNQLQFGLVLGAEAEARITQPIRLNQPHGQREQLLDALGHVDRPGQMGEGVDQVQRGGKSHRSWM